MTSHIFPCLSTAAIAILGNVKSQKPAITDSGWSDFRCFNDTETKEYQGLFNLHEAKRDLHGELTFLSDDWSLSSFVISILQRELFGVNVYLWDFYEGAPTFAAFMMTAYSKTFVTHWGILEDDFVPAPDADLVSGGEAPLSLRTTWAMRVDVARDLEEQLRRDLRDGCDVSLDLWRSFTRSDVVAAMDNASLVVIPPRDDGTMPCSEWYECMYGDSTWYPPHCDPIANDCMVLLQFLPEHDSELNRDLILNYNLSIVIKYMGSPRTHYGQANFKTFYAEKYRVIFQMRSIDAFSADGYGWNSIVLPADVRINDNQPIFQVGSGFYHSWSMSAGQTLLGSNVALEKTDVDWIHDDIFLATSNGTEDETKDIRMQAACDWMKTAEGKEKWNHWVWFSTHDDVVSGPHCNTIDDHLLQILDGWAEEDLWGVDWDPESENDDDHSKLIREINGKMVDSFATVYVKRNCISDRAEEENLALLVSGYFLAAFVLLLLVLAMAAVIIWRKEKIIVSSSIKLTAVLVAGALFALSVVLFTENDIVGHCIMRMYVVQIGVTLMFGSLGAKIWRLSVIHENIKLLRSVEISENSQMKRIGVVLLLVMGFLTILVLVFPIEVQMSIVNGNRTKMCQWDGSAETAYNMLLLVEGLVFFFVARTAWSIKSVNDVYNEHKWIGSTLLGAVLIIAGYLIVGLLGQSDTTLIVQSLLISMLVMLVTSLLMLPRLRIIWLDAEYQPDSFEHDSLTFASSLLTKKDLHRMRSLLRKFGYRVIKKDSRGNVMESSVTGSAWSTTVGKRMSKLWSNRYSHSSDLLKRSTSSHDIHLSVRR